MEDVTDTDYTHTESVCKELEKKYFEEYRDLYVQTNTLLLADGFENFRNTCLEIYDLDPEKFFRASELAW